MDKSLVDSVVQKHFKIRLSTMDSFQSAADFGGRVCYTVGRGEVMVDGEALMFKRRNFFLLENTIHVESVPNGEMNISSKILKMALTDIEVRK